MIKGLKGMIEKTDPTSRISLLKLYAELKDICDHDTKFQADAAVVCSNLELMGAGWKMPIEWVDPLCRVLSGVHTFVLDLRISSAIVTRQ